MSTDPLAPIGDLKRSDSDVVFFKLNPAAGKHCGLTKIVLKGTITAAEGGGVLWIYRPIAEMNIEICIPWFLRG